MGSIQQFCDMYLTYTRFRLVKGNISKSKAAALGLFLFATTYLTWVPFYTILPFWIDCSAIAVVSVQNALYNYVYITVSMALYNIMFTGYFVIVLIGLGGEGTHNAAEKGKLRILGIKSIIHCIIR